MDCFVAFAPRNDEIEATSHRHSGAPEGRTRNLEVPGSVHRPGTTPSKTCQQYCHIFPKSIPQKACGSLIPRGCDAAPRAVSAVHDSRTESSRNAGARCGLGA